MGVVLGCVPGMALYGDVTGDWRWGIGVKSCVCAIIVGFAFRGLLCGWLVLTGLVRDPGSSGQE